MDSSSSFLSEDQFLCSVCLDVFTEPVSIPCGHNFCKTCITRHWQGKQQCQCPLCNEKFNKGLKLCVNTAFREVVEDFKKHRPETSRDTSHLLVKPGQVPCDCCLGNKFRASKTCLVCLASYCEIHLEPHQRVEALKRHTLTDPVQNLEDKICKKHNRVLELFCRSDLTCICSLCTEHSDHDTVPLDKALANRKGHVGKKKAEIQAKPKSGKKAQKTKAAVQPKRKDQATPNNVASNQMQAPHICWFPNEGPQNFNGCSCVPGNRGFPEGGVYYEIHVKLRTNWHLGVVTHSVFGTSTFTQIHRNGPCIIRLENDKNCKALQNSPVYLHLIKTPKSVLVFVDYETELYFYDQDTDILMFSLAGCRFIERILLYFVPVPIKNDTQRLQRKVQKMKAWLLSHDPLCLIGLVFIILFFIIEILPE